MAQVRFISGDGVEHEVEEASAAAEIMRNAGFQQLNAAGEPFVYTLEDAIAQNNGLDESTEAKAKAAIAETPDRSKKTKAELIAEAEELELDLVPDKVTKAQIIAAIEAKLAETAEVNE
ncbi:MAG: hypothetical protein IPG22_16575 [Acidobacteria bacterium]|nr:hypothetical protein [Acidobacteriota bacterium]